MLWAALDNELFNDFFSVVSFFDPVSLFILRSHGL
jgi:hypothetical protein